MRRITRKVVCIAIGLCVLMGFAGCTIKTNDGPVVKGNGNVTTEERAVGIFDSIDLSGVGAVSVSFGVSFGDSCSVSVSVDSNLQSLVKTEVNGGVLRIYEDGNVTTKKKFTIDVTMPLITSVDMSGAGSVTLSEGSAAKLEVLVSGVGSVDAQNYQVKDAVVELSGAGSLKIWATDSLSGEISGVGSVRYKGDPELNVNISGLGSLKPL